MPVHDDVQLIIFTPDFCEADEMNWARVTIDQPAKQIVAGPSDLYYYFLELDRSPWVHSKYL